MSNDNDPTRMFPAEKLARERGYFEKPASELLRIAQELWKKSTKSARAQSKTVMSMEMEKELLEYAAVTNALSHEDYIAHVKAMAELDRLDQN